MSPMMPHPMTVEYALLGFLHQKPMHGYEINQQLADPDRLGLVWRLKQSQLYALLSKLEEKGHIIARIEIQNARPPRKVYQLTGSGSQAYFHWICSPVSHGRQMRLDFLAKLYFARLEGSDYATQLIEAQSNRCREWLRTLERQAETFRKGDSPSFPWFVCQYRIGQVQASLDWLDTCRESL